ncbi:CDP-alcohol phosphatidyltransferase family protein [Quadrisphaera granulorum]|uniref:CDP-alcohol phosphatidyltransferase family protein n=1 Tax=Quadrisphaera granulorum TaxID=317664 RepID=UPI001FEB8F11|nr:CDP-alcohol phosphatidyltransferase family protein [Quadrisphaera granulorum]
MRNDGLAGTAEHPADRVLTVPNALSALRLLLVPVFAALILGGHDLWALLVLAVSGASDWLDGRLARRWQQVTRLGQVLDPAADRLFIFAALLGMALRELVPWWLVVVIVARDLGIVALGLLLARLGRGPLPVSDLGKAATFALLYAFPLILLASLGGPVGAVARPLGWAFAMWGTALYWWAGLRYAAHVRVLMRARAAA